MAKTKYTRLIACYTGRFKSLKIYGGYHEKVYQFYHVAVTMILLVELFRGTEAGRATETKWNGNRGEKKHQYYSIYRPYLIDSSRRVYCCSVARLYRRTI